MRRVCVHEAWQAVDTERASWNSKSCSDTAEAATIVLLHSQGNLYAQDRLRAPRRLG